MKNASEMRAFWKSTQDSKTARAALADYYEEQGNRSMARAIRICLHADIWPTKEYYHFEEEEPYSLDVYTIFSSIIYIEEDIFGKSPRKVMEKFAKMIENLRDIVNR